MAYTKYSLTPADNNSAPPNGAPEGMLPSAVNDTMRDMMAQIRDVGDGIRGGTYTMTAPVITGGSINGTTVGATTASTGAFTTLAASGTTTLSANQIISVTDNSNAALRITQLGTGNALLVEDSANPDASPFVINADGRVILGDTSANAIGVNSKLQISGTAADAFAQIVRFNSAASGNNPGLTLARSRGTLFSARTAVQAEDALGQIGFFGDDGTNWVNAALIQSFVDGTPGTNDMPGRLVFSTTADGASSPTERMRINNAGNIGIGGTAGSFQKLALLGTYPNDGSSQEAVSARGAFAGTINSNATFISRPTVASAAVLANLFHFNANPNTFTGTVTNQFGFSADANITGATNNYGFNSNIASGTNRWNFYAAGTANNYMAGRLGIGSTSLTDRILAIGANITGATTAYGQRTDCQINSDVTTFAAGYATRLFTQAAAFTLTELVHYQAFNPAFGAGSAVTNQHGFKVESSLTGATNNYAFFGNVAAASGRFNLYMNGTAANYFGGDMQFNKTVTAGGTTGAQTISKNAGTVNFAAAATSLVVTNTLVTANSIIICTVGTNDTTMKSVSVVAGSGSFTIHANAAATAETRVNFIVIN